MCTNIGVHTYLKQILTELKREITIAGGFNTPLSTLDRSPRHKINKKIVNLSNTIYQVALTEIHRTLYPIAPKTLFSNSHGTFSMIDHMSGHKTSLNKFKNIEIISSIFSKHNGIKLEIINRKKMEKFTNTRKLNNTLLNNQWIREIRKYLETNKNTTYPKLRGCSKNSSKRKVYSNKCLH